MLDLFDQWLRSEGKSSGTIKVYLNAVKKLITWYGATEGHDFLPEKVTTLHIHEFQSYMDKAEKLEPATINKIIASLKTFFLFAMDANFLTYNPMVKVKIKRTMTQYSAPKWLSKQEVAKFFHSIEQVSNVKQKTKDMAICRLMVGAGLRVQEVSSLDVSDICLDKKKEDVIIRSGKGNKYRIVPLNRDVSESLEEWLNCRDDLDVRTPLFVTKRGTRLSARLIHRMVVKYAQKARLVDVSPHTLRHTFCKSLVDQGIGIERIAYLAGHESLETTRRYIQPSLQELRKAVQTISEKR